MSGKTGGASGTRAGESQAEVPARSPYADAELYDVIFAGYREDLDFYVSAAKQARGPVLEVGCGTGRVMIPCLQAGADVDGVDLHAEMLAVLKRKADTLGLKPRVYQADMRDFTTPRRYALVVIPFNAFVHNLTTADQLKSLRVCREHLDPGGALIISLFHPSFDLITATEGVPVLEMETTHPETGSTLRLYDTRTMDRVNQVQHSKNEIQELDAAGNVITVHRSETAMRWTYKAEMELLLHVAGYARWQIAGGFDGRPLMRDDQQMIVTAWRD